MSRSARHSEWEAPLIKMDLPNPTITIRPATEATYIPLDWKLELDQEAIFERLIYDVYNSPSAYIRELIQNALDANRCQMYLDLQKEGGTFPILSTDVEEVKRQKYPVKVSLKTKEVRNALSGEAELKQLLIVEDSGIGMDQNIIQRYFLQVGRSYYKTDEFQRNFRFHPTSRFGLGFLSVFAVSDNVTVETYKPSSSHGKPIRLTLTGPRNYVLTEASKRNTNGTTIEVLLRDNLEPGELLNLVTTWCRFVEFPVIVLDHDTETIIEAERSEQFTYEVPVVTLENAQMAVRAFPINRTGINGYLYVFSLLSSEGETWALYWPWSQQTYPTDHPQAHKPEMPGDLMCLNGITISAGTASQKPVSTRLDFRHHVATVPLSRQTVLATTLGGLFTIPEIASRWEELLGEHLSFSSRSTSEAGWKYKQELIKHFPLPSFWASAPETIQLHEAGKPVLTSLNQLQELSELWTVIIPTYVQTGVNASVSEMNLSGQDLSSVLVEEDLNILSQQHREAIFKQRAINSVRWLPSGHIALQWNKCQDPPIRFTDDCIIPTELVSLNDMVVIGASAHKTTGPAYNHAFLNRDHPFVQWLINVKEACEANLYGLKMEHFNRLITLLRNPVRFRGNQIQNLTTYLDRWRSFSNLPAELYPPPIELSNDMFAWQKPKAPTPSEPS